MTHATLDPDDYVSTGKVRYIKTEVRSEVHETGIGTCMKQVLGETSFV